MKLRVVLVETHYAAWTITARELPVPICTGFVFNTRILLSLFSNVLHMEFVVCVIVVFLYLTARVLNSTTVLPYMPCVVVVHSSTILLFMPCKVLHVLCI